MSKGHGEKKSRQQEKAIIALLTEPTLREAASKVGISESTLWRWQQDTDFNDQFRAAKKQAVSNAVSQLQQSCGEAVSTLRDIMNDVTAPHPSRVTAAKTILEMSLKAVEIEELESRIEQLEELQQDSNRLKNVR